MQVHEARSLWLAVLLVAISACAQPEPPTGTVTQPLVAGTVVSDQTQSDLRLLTLASPTGSCSASMLNSSWAITAAHCAYPANTSSSGTPAYLANQITLSAAWIPNLRPVAALKLVVFDKFPFNTADIALVQVPIRSFDNPQFSEAMMWGTRLRVSDALTSFGRGINAFAFQSSAGPVPSAGDGLYRQGSFSVTGVSGDASFYNFAGNLGVSTAGGDSGGPSFIPVWDNPDSPTRKLILKLVGVHSKCSISCLSGQSCKVPPATSPWQWAAGASSCSDAAVFPLLAQINAAIQAPGDTPSPGSFDTTVPASVLAHPRALYAVSIDEPLLPSPGAAVDIQLTFKQCHAFLQIGNPGCPLDPSLQLWGYDVSNHRMLHLASGKCLNISGARRDAGAPIILFPCSGAPNEKWTIISPPGSSTWILQSDLTKQCLNATPGRSGGGHGPTAQIPTPATLTQMPCNRGTSQQFADANASFAQQHGPH